MMEDDVVVVVVATSLEYDTDVKTISVRDSPIATVVHRFPFCSSLSAVVVGLGAKVTW